MRVQAPNYEVLCFWVVVVTVQVLGKCMITSDSDPWGNRFMEEASWFWE